MKKKRSKLLFISMVLGVAYLIYNIIYWSSANAGGGDTAETIGAGLATALVFPHIICSGVAAIFNILGWSMNHRGFALTGAILYAVSLILFPLYFMFVIIQMILSFVGFAKLKGIIAINQEISSVEK
jgi:hypothetical protein